MTPHQYLVSHRRMTGLELGWIVFAFFAAAFVKGVTGLTGSQIMSVLPYLVAVALAPAGFVQAINISFTVSGLVPVFLGIKLGSRSRWRLSPDMFRRVVLILLPVLGSQLALRAAFMALPPQSQKAQPTTVDHTRPRLMGRSSEDRRGVMEVRLSHRASGNPPPRRTPDLP